MQCPILFDLDGTLTNPEPGFLASLHYALEHLDIEPPPDRVLTRFIGPPLRQTMGALLKTNDPDLIEKGVELYRWRLDQGGKFEAHVIDGMPEVLRHFHEKGHPLFVCTGKPEPVAREIIDYFELRPWFREVYGAQLDGTHGDKADLVAHIWKQEALESRPGILIGDTIFDVEAALANDLTAIGVRWGFGEPASLLEAGVHDIASTAADLLSLIPRYTEKQ